MMRRLLLILLLYVPLALWGEGTREVAPASSDPSTLLPMGSSTNFAGYDEADEWRLYIDIEDFTNETIYFGFQENQSGTVYFRIKDPSGTIVYGPTAIPGAGAGYVGSHAQAVVGPVPLGGGGGYTPLSYTPVTNGSHYIEFNYNNSTSKSTNTMYIDLWDISVGDNTTSNEITGRIHSKTWAFSAGSYSTAFNSQFYIYSSDSIVTRLDLNGMQPYEFFINCNSYGVQNTGNFSVDRMSIASFATAPEYRIFLNDPDSTIYPTGLLTTTLSSTPTIVGCDSAYCIQVDYSKAATAQVVISLNGVNGYQAGTEDVLLGQQVVRGANCFWWDGLDGLGNPVTANQNIRLESTVVTGLTNFPVWDAECNPNGFIVDVIRPTRPRPNLFYDDTNLGGAANTVTGCVAPCHSWATGGGCGSGSIGNNKLVNTYWFTSTDYVAYLALLPYCAPIAAVDSASIVQDNPVVIDVLANDQDANDDIVNSSTSIASGPSNGSITSINGTTGEITYTPNAGFIGADSFLYVVCDAQSLCDSAMVYINVQCAAGSNEINGYVFYDYSPSNGTMDGPDVGVSGVDVRVFRDENDDGLLDGGDNLLTTVTTNGTGSYTYTPNDNLRVIRRRIGSSSDDAEQDIEGGDFGDMNLTSSDLDLSEGYTSGSSATAVGVRFTGLNIPPGVNIDSASITFTARSNESGSTSLIFQVEEADNPGTYTSANSNISSRTFSVTNVIWPNVPGWSNDDQYTTPKLGKPGTIDRRQTGLESGNAISFGITGTNQEREAHSYNVDDGDTNKIPLLYIRFSDFPAGYIMEVDTTTAPAGYTLTTDNLEYASFTAANQSDCRNNFGLFNSVGFWPLAIENIDFRAERKENKVLTSWDILSDDVNSLYIVERSIDGKNFSTIGSIESDTTGFLQLEFEMYDDHPVNREYSYYRLRVRGSDGAFRISDMAKISPVPTDFEFARIYPSVVSANGQIFIELEEEEDFLDLNIYAVNGQNVYSSRLNTEGQLILPVNLDIKAKGMYLVKLVGENKVLNQNIILK